MPPAFTFVWVFIFDFSFIVILPMPRSAEPLEVLSWGLKYCLLIGQLAPEIRAGSCAQSHPAPGIILLGDSDAAGLHVGLGLHAISLVLTSADPAQFLSGL
jgi:hypothetical protein